MPRDFNLVVLVVLDLCDDEDDGMAVDDDESVLLLVVVAAVPPRCGTDLIMIRVMPPTPLPPLPLRPPACRIVVLPLRQRPKRNELSELIERLRGERVRHIWLLYVHIYII